MAPHFAHFPIHHLLSQWMFILVHLLWGTEGVMKFWYICVREIRNYSVITPLWSEGADTGSGIWNIGGKNVEYVRLEVKKCGICWITD